MKIQCKCGHLIVDSTDDLPYKGHVIADQNLHSIKDLIDYSIEKSGPSVEEKETACMNVRNNFTTRFIWQCQECSRLYLDNKKNELVCFTPEDSESNDILLQAHE